jgi:hypothetical protein
MKASKKIIHEIQKLIAGKTGLDEFYDKNVKREIDEMPDTHAKAFITYIRGMIMDDEKEIDDSLISFHCHFNPKCNTCEWGKRHGVCYKDENSLHMQLTKSKSIIFQIGLDNIITLLNN